MKGRLSEFAMALGARLVGDDARFRGAGIDTRCIERGALFFALAGTQSDGHCFVAEAARCGAAAAIVDHPVKAPIPQLVVDDVATALERAARLARVGFTGPVVGVTGSNGKTTVKQMLAAICAQVGSVVATEGNLNNHLGVPLTLMRLDSDVERAVIEMGANHRGEIGQLAAIARPDVGVVTNAGTAHIEGFGSREGIARGKGELFIRLPARGTAVINADDGYADLWRKMAAGREIVTFSMDADSNADIRADEIRFHHGGARFVIHVPGESFRVELGLVGRHNVMNALAAAGAATALGLTGQAISAGLARMTSVSGRLSVTPCRFGSRLVDDSYNANPDSLAAALDWLGEQPGPRWAALGDMGELGDYSELAHRDAGQAARRAGVQRLFLTGPLSRITADAFGEGAQWYPDHHRLSTALLESLADSGEDTIILVKGSRNARMDIVADALRCDDTDRRGALSC